MLWWVWWWLFSCGLHTGMDGSIGKFLLLSTSTSFRFLKWELVSLSGQINDLRQLTNAAIRLKWLPSTTTIQPSSRTVLSLIWCPLLRFRKHSSLQDLAASHRNTPPYRLQSFIASVTTLLYSPRSLLYFKTSVISASLPVCSARYHLAQCFCQLFHNLTLIVCFFFGFIFFIHVRR